MQNENKIENDLANMAAAYGAGRNKALANPNKSRTFVPVPDGTYEGIIESLSLQRTRERRLPMLVWEIVISDGEFSGRKEWHKRVLTPSLTDDDWERITNDLLLCGIDCPQEDFGKLASYLPQAEKLKLRFTIKTVTRGEKTYRNTYLEELLSDPNRDMPIEELPSADEFPV